jgi:hypothetical protein
MTNVNTAKAMAVLTSMFLVKYRVIVFIHAG